MHSDLIKKIFMKHPTDYVRCSGIHHQVDILIPGQTSAASENWNNLVNLAPAEWRNAPGHLAWTTHFRHPDRRVETGMPGT